MKIKYVGLKDYEDAFKSETGVVWGPGIEHDIENPTLAARMLKHPDVFALVESAPVKEPKQPEPQAVEAPQADDSIPTAEEKPVTGHIIETPDGKQHVLDGMERDELRALAKTYNIPTGNSGADKIRERLTEAFPKG